MASTSSEWRHALSYATTLHVTLLTSHYAVQRREAPPSSKMSSGMSQKTAGSEDVEVYSCSTAAEQLDTVARVLCAVLQQGCSAGDSGAVDTVRRIQMAKAIRDDFVPWTDVAAAAAAAQGDDPHALCLPPRPPGRADDGHPNLTPASAAATPPSSAAGVKKGEAQHTATSKDCGSTLQQRRPGSVKASSSRSSMHSSSTLSGVQRRMSKVDQDQRQLYLAKELPPCELVVIPGATLASAPSCVIFVYRLAHEEDVLAALSALSVEKQSSSAEEDAPATDSGKSFGREKLNAQTSQAATIVTRALWSTVWPILRAHLHATSSSAVPAHMPVVWAMADPRMLSGFLPYTLDDTDNILSPCPCPVPVSPSLMRSPDEEAVVVHWVRLVPRTAFCLYDPSASSAAVQDTLGVLHAHLAKGAQSHANSPRGQRRLSSSGGTKKLAPKGTTTKASRASSPAFSGPGGAKGRNTRGAAGVAGTAATIPSAQHKTSLQSRELSREIDLQATPAEFPYCIAHPLTLAHYLYLGSLAATPSPPQATALTAPSSSPADLGMELTWYLSKMTSFQGAVMTASEADMVGLATEEAFKRMWRTHASLLRWVRAYLSNSAALLTTGGSAVELVSGSANGNPQMGHQRPSVTFEEAVRLSLSRTVPDASKWPLPLWEVAALPIAPVPPLTLRCSGPDDAPMSTSVTTESIMQWGAGLLSVVVGDGRAAGDMERCDKAPLMSVLTRLAHLIDAYNGWSLKSRLTLRWDANSDGCNGTRGAVTVKAPGDHSVGATVTPQRSIVTACCAGGVFNIMSAVCAWMATVSESLLLQQPLRELTALCATAESLASRSAGQHVVSNVATPTTLPPSGLFRRYAQPFQTLSVPGSGGAKAIMNTGAVAAIVPQPPKATETPTSEAAAAAAAQLEKRCTATVSARIHHQSTDVTLPPYPQEVSWMVRHVIAKNAGHFEVNVARGTDTVTPAAARPGLSLAVHDLATGGSSSLTARQSTMATMTITTQSTGFLLQQQRRRLRRHTSGVAAKLQPYSQSVHLIKEMARNLLGRRPLAEAAVALQGALESTLVAPHSEVAADEVRSGCEVTPLHQSCKKHRGESAGGSATGTQQVSALDLLQRYLASVDTRQAHLAIKSKSAQPKCPALLPERHHSIKTNENEMLATQAAAENLTPRIYEHLLQQALLHQLLRETGLESTHHSASLHRHGHVPIAAREEAACTNDDWSVTQQLPVQVIVASIVDFQERFGAHNVAWRSCALHYRPLPSRTATGYGSAGKGVGTVASSGDKDDEVHRTSAYAHNALNVHPTRRVTHMWVAGVAVPDVQMAEVIENGRRLNSDAKLEQKSRPSLRQRRSRRWVDMVPRAGSVTSVEVYALWQSLLQHQQQGTDGEAAAAKPIGATATGAKTPLRVGPAELTMRAMHDLISQYMQRHAEVSTSLVTVKGVSSESSKTIAATECAPMRFDTHETLYLYGDAVVEVWVSEVQRLCRYIKATEIIATLHATPSSTGVHNVHLTVHWDDGLLFTCTSHNTRQDCSSTVPLIDVMLTTCNVVLQRREGESRIRICRYPNTSSSTTAAAAVSLKELSGRPTAALPHGGVMEACTALLEERVTLYCVHHCPTEFTAATPMELEASSEVETSCVVNERTGVVQRFYASGMQQLLFPSGAIMVRRPLTPVFAKPSAFNSTSQYCDTLVALDGRCFVRNGSSRGDTSADAPLASSETVQPSSFQRVQVRIACENSRGMTSHTGADEAHAPPFTRSEIAYDAVHHCRMRSREDGLTVAEYESLTTPEDTGGTHNDGRVSTTLARVVVFPDGTTITTVAPRETRRRALVRHLDDTSTWASLSSPTLCALLEELQAVEDSLFGAAADAEELSVRWCVEASALPRLYLAPTPVGGSDEARAGKAAFAAIFGDGTVLQRRWAAAPTSSAPSSTTDVEVDASVDADEEQGLERGGVEESGTHGTLAYRGGTFETVLVRPSTSAVRVLHHHGIVTIEPADVLASITHASPAAYAVGQGLPFFDLACGGGLRMVDGARCVWEVCGLAEANEGPQVLHPERASTYEELLRALVSPHYSPHRLPRAAQLTYAREQRRETAAYARRRDTGWCPSLLRRMREVAEPFIRTAQLLRMDVLAPIEAAAAATDEQVFYTGNASATASTTVRGGVSAAGRLGFPSRGIPPQCISRVLPVCFGQLDNGEAIRYWHVSEVLPSLSESCASSTLAAASEPQVIQRLVPGIATGSVLGYISTAPGHTCGADTIGILLCGDPTATSGNRSVLWQRLATVARLSLLCCGVLAPAIPPAIKPPLTASFASEASSLAPQSAGSYAASLPPLAVLLSHGSRWLPATLQPPQQFGAYRSKPSTVGAAAEVEYADVAWVRDSTATLSNAAANTAYVQYVLDQVNPITAVKTSRAALQREVARKELHRHEQLAQLSHYHRMLSTQWPMEMPASAREEQVRLERRFEELQRIPRSAVPPPAMEEQLPFPSVIGSLGSSERMVV
ncbi:hypothetical protein MNV84_07276 [Leishmania braziliensis]|nr:hypothetical protein MNV84_07276 [Leishmania braziliensis]